MVLKRYFNGYEIPLAHCQLSKTVFFVPDVEVAEPISPYYISRFYLKSVV